MSQSGTINSYEGAVSAKLFAEGSDTVAATASSVTAGTNDPTLYTIVFSGVSVGDYRIALYDSAGDVVDSGAVITMSLGSWEIKTCDTGTDTGGGGGGGDDEDTEATESTSVATAIVNPKSATADGVSVQSHSLPELIAAENHLAKKSAASKPGRGMRFSKLIPSGTIGDYTGT